MQGRTAHGVGKRLPHLVERRVVRASPGFGSGFPLFGDGEGLRGGADRVIKGALRKEVGEVAQTSRSFYNKTEIRNPRICL